jgi:uncharacterized membrane protein YdjX (TVP38/TMEM64 family)
VRSLALLGGLVLAGLALHLLADRGPSGLLAGLTASHDTAGIAAFCGLGTLLCAVGVPRQIVAYAAGYAFGFWPGTCLSLLAQVVACAADFGWARLIGRDWARRVMQRRWQGRLARIDGFLTANPFAATLTLRLLPVGNNLALNLLAGISGIAALPFVAASALGYVPLTMVFSLLGAGTRVDRATQLGIAVLLFALSAAVGTLLLRRFRGVAVA